MDDDPILVAYETGAARPRLSIVETQRPAVPISGRGALELHPARLPDPATIPPRRWLYGTQLIRGYVTVLVAPGGTGKSAYAMGVVLSLVAGKPLLGDHIFQSVNGAMFNLEDPMEELERRLAALMMRHKVADEDVRGRLYLDDGENRGLTIASLGDDGFSVVHPDEEALIEQIRQKEVGVLSVDPFAESHTLEENSNPQMVKAAAAWRRVARLTGCAVLLVHHVRKGDASGIDAARGAKALTDSARVGLLMSTMSLEEGESFNIAADDRWQYVRLDDAKRNMAPAAKARWMKLEQVEIGNSKVNPLYPKGDKVAAVVAWEPPSLWQERAPSDLNEALDAIQAGHSPGVPFSRTKSTRWAGAVLMDKLGVTERQAKEMIDAWFKSGLLSDAVFTHPQWRRPAAGVQVDDSKRPTGTAAQDRSNFVAEK